MNSETEEVSPLEADAEVNVLEHPDLLLAAIIDSCDDAIISKNLNGIVTSWNGAASRMFGYAAEEIVGQSILKLIPLELYPEEDEILRKLRAGNRIDHYETTRIRKNGQAIEVSLTISPVKDNTGRVIGTSKIARDMSVRKQMERMLILSEKLAATGRMAATIAHEINNPLEAVMNLIFLARQNTAGGSPARGYLQTAEKEIERVSHIARQTLGFYRDTGSPSKVLLHEIIEEVLTVYHSKLRARGITIECQFDDHQPVQARRGELIQVFSNVIANSVDAMAQGGVLHIRINETVKDQTTELQVTIRDEGIGIEVEHMGKVFEPFFSTKGNLGNGIGLWVAKQLVENHGGTIAVTSSTVAGDSGTAVFISMPSSNPQSGFVKELA